MKRALKILIPTILLLAAAVWAVQRWIDTGTAAARAVCIYSAESAQALDVEAVSAALEAGGLSASVIETDDVAEQAQASLRDGASVLIVSLDAVPENKSLLDAAQTHDADLFFTGIYPGDDYLDAYDKAYYVGSRPEYAGELIGRAAAMAWRAGTLPDANGDLLAEYLAAGSGAPAETMLESALAECEHYGVYTQPCRIAYAADAQAADSSSAAADAQAVSGAADAAAASAATDASAQSVLAQTPETDWDGLDFEPEVILCFGGSACTDARSAADARGWTSRADPPVFFAVTESFTQAQQAADSGCSTVIYYDSAAVSTAVSQMVLNLCRQNYIAQDTGLSPDAHRALWVPYQTYTAAAADAADSAAQGDSAQSGTAGSAAS
jgi:hypothetical protein